MKFRARVNRFPWRWAVLLLAAVALTPLALSACGTLGKANPTPLPTVVLGSGGSGGASGTAAPAGAATPSSSAAVNAAGSSSGGVTASGVVAPAQTAQLAATQSGSVDSVLVADGDVVEAGQVLVKLGGGEQFSAVLETAKTALLSAQQDLKTLSDNADQARSAAQLRLANAEKALDAAEKKRTSKEYRNGSQSAIDAAQANVILAKAGLDHAEDIYSGVANNAADDVNRAEALSALSAARNAYDRALANLNYLLAMPKQIDVNQADAELASAQAEVDEAQKAYDALKDGPDPDALALAQQRVKNAQAEVEAGQVALDHLELKAPFAGTITSVKIQAGEWVIPGQAMVGIADLNHLRVETTDLSERDVPEVAVGQAVNVQVKALGQDVAGKVAEIAPLADTLGGDVVYKTTIDLNSIPEGLRSGMSVEVSFGALP
jgi:multidrug efflux pump subunit AcrA (membrane-fusion protein)